MVATLEHYPREKEVNLLPPKAAFSPNSRYKSPETIPIAPLFQDSFTLRCEDYNYPCETINVQNSLPEWEPKRHQRHPPSDQSASEKASSVASDWTSGVPLCRIPSRFDTGEFARDPSAPEIT